MSLTLQITAVMEITTTDSSGGLPWVIIPDFESFSTSNIYHQGHRKHAAVSCDTERNEEFPSGTNVTCVQKQKSLKNRSPRSIRHPSWTKVGGRAARMLTEMMKWSYEGCKYIYDDHIEVKTGLN